MYHLYHEVGDKTVPTADGEPQQMLLVLLSCRKEIRKFIFGKCLEPGKNLSNRPLGRTCHPSLE
jgi:hypothetical protein